MDLHEIWRWGEYSMHLTISIDSWNVYSSLWCDNDVDTVEKGGKTIIVGEYCHKHRMEMTPPSDSRDSGIGNERRSRVHML